MSEQVEKPGKRRAGGRPTATAAVGRVRSVAGAGVWVAAVACALLLAVGALFVVLDFNRDNGVVSFFIQAADNVNLLGTLKSFTPDGKGEAARHSAEVKSVLVNWGIAAVVYLVVGKVAERLIRP